MISGCRSLILLAHDSGHGFPSYISHQLRHSKVVEIFRNVNYMGMMLNTHVRLWPYVRWLDVIRNNYLLLFHWISFLFSDVVGRLTDMKQRACGCGLCNVSTIKSDLATLLPSDPTAKERSNTRLLYPIRAPPAKTHQSLDLFLTKVGQTSNSGLSTGHSFVLSELCEMSSGEDPLFTIDDTPLLFPLAPYPVYTFCGGESG